MPYIKQSQRDLLDSRIMGLAASIADLGELNYVLTGIINRYMKRVYDRTYTSYSMVLGTIEAVKMELYRRGVAPYEDQKRAENGDVYGYE